MCDAKGAHDQSNINPGNRCGGSDHRWLRNESSRRNDLAVSCHSEGLPSVVGNLAVDSWRGQREAGTRKCGAKYDPGYRPEHVPISKSQRSRDTSSRALHRQPKRKTKTSGLNCRRWVECRSGDARHIRDHRRHASACLLGSAGWPAPDRVQVRSGEADGFYSIGRKSGPCRRIDPVITPSQHEITLVSRSSSFLAPSSPRNPFSWSRPD